MMLRLFVGAVALSMVCFAEERAIRVFPAEANKIQSEYVSARSAPRQVLVGPADQIFPHIATGGGWETVIVIVNMSTNAIPFRMRFFGTDGRPMPVTFRTFPELQTVTTAVAEGRLTRIGTSFNFALFDSTPITQVGWGSLEYDSTLGRLGAYALFRQRVSSRGTDFEALVPLSAYDDFKFFLPFDNIQGFTTAIALANPGANLTSNISVTALNLNGELILRDTVVLPPGNQTSFVLADRFPALAGRLGTLYIESDTTRLSAMGIRFNAAGGFSFSSIPIMNWSGMFQ